MSGTGFGKNISYQGRGVGDLEILEKNTKMRVKILILASIFSCFYIQLKGGREEGNKRLH